MPGTRLARRMDRVGPSAIMELIKTTGGGGYLSFASGLPDPSLFPVEPIRAIADEVLTRDGAQALQYGPAEGYPPLRAVAAELLCSRGLPTSPEEVLITNGSQQALDLAARAILDPGDLVALEAPTYLAALQTFDSQECRYFPVPMDGEGMLAASLEDTRDVRAVYTLPNFQNPTGLTMSDERRARLARLADRHGWLVIEDDAYHDLRFEGEGQPPVASLLRETESVYLGTFSKTVAPGLRVGYARASRGLIERLGQLKQITDLHTGSLTQRIVYEYCRRGLLADGIRRFNEAYRSRRDALLHALDQELTGLASWTRPRGGMFVFVTLPETMDASRLLTRCLEQRLVFVPGSGFFPAGGGHNTLRLNFVSVDEDGIRRGIPLLAAAIRACAG